MGAEKKPDVSLRIEIDMAITRCLTILEEYQHPEGYWSTEDYPALSALILKAFVNSPVDNERWRSSPAVVHGLEYIKSCVQDDGGIYNRGLYSYNTAISLMALAALNDPELEETITKGREFLVGQQQLDEWDSNEGVYGGVGYGNSYPHSDLSNTSLAIQALHETRSYVGKEAGSIDLDWEAALQFLENCQNLPSHNKQPWVSDDENNYGGFVYFPGNSKAGTETLASGKEVHRSYGSMSYAGLMSFLYAGLEPDDERVLAAVDWLQKNWSLEENPGMGLEGLYYYYFTMAKALDAFGEDYLVLKDGSKIDWRKELAVKLISVQRNPGFWQNENGRWMENDPYIVSAYTVLALERLYPGI